MQGARGSGDWGVLVHAAGGHVHLLDERLGYNTGVSPRIWEPRHNRSGPRLARVAIERLAAGGDGVGRDGAKVVFVPYTAPGDEIEAEIFDERRTWCRGRTRRVLRASADRVAPRCTAFGSCGGCNWQHLAYPVQLAAKRTIVAEALRRIGRLDPPPAAQTVPSPGGYGYRCRARLHAAGRGGAVRFGFFSAGSHEVVPVKTCPVLHPSLDVALAALADAAQRHPAAFAGIAEARIDTCWDGSMVRLALRGTRGASTALSPGASRALSNAAAAGGVRLLFGDDAHRPLPLGPGDDALVTTGETFTQVNLANNQALVGTVLGLAAPRAGEEVLDLYCGLGNLALPTAARGARVLGADLNAEAVRQARENATRLGRETEFVRGDAAAVARELRDQGRRFALVLLNPPRTGARDTVAAVAALAPARVVMVSCDPATLARDAAAFRAAGYRLDAVAPIDLFPQTAHVETVTLFTPGP